MITSAGNTQIRNVINLVKKSKDRKASGLFVVEGRKMFEETPNDRIEKVYVSEAFWRGNRDFLKKYDYETVSDDVFLRMSDTRTPQGIMALVRMRECGIDKMLEGKRAPLILVLENLQDPGNLGTIIRTAEGAGADGIIMTSGTVDIYNPKVIRSTMGSLYRMKFTYVEDIVKAVGTLKKHNVNIYAAHLGGAVDYVTCDYTVGTAFLIGNEGNGLSDKASELAHKKIIIPMAGRLESLNAAVSSAVLMFEVFRQRRG